ncbi:MAG: hypothetical protein FJ027_16235, partial [Candidatus Rokubacteria bacterium]|nr:hypothetical protein [Candidatus Rokubacteria bacterium]
FAQAFAFRWAVDNDLAWERFGEAVNARHVLRTLVEAIFFGVIRPLALPLGDYGSLGALVRMNQRDGAALMTFTQHHRLVAGSHPDVLVFPSAALDAVAWAALVSDVTAAREAAGAPGDAAFEAWCASLEPQPGEPDWLRHLRRDARTESVRRVDLRAVTIATVAPPVAYRNGVRPFPLAEYVGRVLACFACHTVLSGLATELPLDAAGRVQCPTCSQRIAVDFGSAGLFRDVAANTHIIWNLRGGARPNGCTAVVYERDAARFLYGRCAIVVPGRVLSDGDVFCDLVTAFRGAKGLRYPDLPVRGDYVRYVTDCVRTHQSAGHATWAVSLVGQPSAISVTVPVRSREEDVASVLVWPNFAAPAWNVYYVYLMAHGDLAVEGLRVRPLFADGTVAPVEVGQRQLARFLRPLARIEVRDNERSLGIFECRDALPPLPERSATLRIGLDFGTANTCLAIQTGDSAQPSHETLALHDLTADVLGAGAFREEIASAGEWLPTFQADPGAAVRMLASELLFDMPPRARTPGPDLLPLNDDHEGLLRLCIPGALVKRQDAVWEAAIVANFKWELPPSSPLAGHRDRVRTEYLRMLLHLVLGELASRYRAAAVTLLPTYPLSFGGERHQDYVTALEAVMGRLRKDTGLTMNFGTTALVNEAYAGRAEAGLANGMEMVIDLGGGSTDIAFSDNKDLTYVDSLRYGGNHLLEVLARPGWEPAIWNDGDAADAQAVRQVRLQRLMRSDRAGGLAALYSEDRRERVRSLVERFFDGVLGYVAILVAGHVMGREGRSGPLSIVLLGNGWNFLNAIGRSQKKHVEEVLSRELAHLGVKTVHPIVHSLAEGGTLRHPMKEAVATGALKSVEPEPRDLDAAIRSVVGCDIILGVQGQAEPVKLAAYDDVPTRPLPGPVRALDCSDLTKKFGAAWKDTRLELGDDDVRQVNRDVMTRGLRRGHGDRLDRSVAAIFVETQFLRRLADLH